MAKDWVGGSAAVFKTLGASNHTDADRQRDQSALQVCAAVCGEGSKHHSRRKEGGDVPETDFPRRQGPTRSLPFYPPHSCLGKLVATEMCHEWRLRQIRQQRRGLRMVRVGERI